MNTRAVAVALLSTAFLAACAAEKETADLAPSTPPPAPAQASRTTRPPALSPTPAPSSRSPAAPTATTPPSPSDDAPHVSRMGLKIRFGIMPGNYDDDQDGVLVDDVYEGTSAADAGIQRGDRLMTWNGRTITDIPRWMEFMSAHNPGDVVDVGVLRGGKMEQIKVTLKGPE